jgi:hypothetical protein
VEAAGIELLPKLQGNAGGRGGSGAESGALRPETAREGDSGSRLNGGIADARLRLIVERWETLSEATRAAVVAMAQEAMDATSER